MIKTAAEMRKVSVDALLADRRRSKVLENIQSKIEYDAQLGRRYIHFSMNQQIEPDEIKKIIQYLKDLGYQIDYLDGLAEIMISW